MRLNTVSKKINNVQGISYKLDDIRQLVTSFNLYGKLQLAELNEKLEPSLKLNLKSDDALVGQKIMDYRITDEKGSR